MLCTEEMGDIARELRISPDTCEPLSACLRTLSATGWSSS